jgi:hypothetical protein
VEDGQESAVPFRRAVLLGIRASGWHDTRRPGGMICSHVRGGPHEHEGLGDLGLGGRGSFCKHFDLDPFGFKHCSYESN